VGWAARPPQQGHGGLDRQPAPLAGGRAAARLRPGAQPDRGLWGNLKGKGGELAYLAGDTLEEVIGAAQRGVERVRRTPHLPYSFLRHSGLDLW
jgi:hypothetical protein